MAPGKIADESKESLFPHAIWEDPTLAKLRLPCQMKYALEFDPQAMYGARLKGSQETDMPRIRTFRPGANNATWQFKWKLPKKEISTGN